MKKIHGFACLGALLLAAGTLAGCGPSYDMTLNVWVAKNIKDLTQQQAKVWAAGIKETTGKNIGVKVTAVGEGEAAGNMITDVQKGADVYGFAQDQLARLRSAGALTAIVDPTLKQQIIDANDADSIAAASVGDELVAYPMTSDNGYFMYYDKSLFPDASVLTDLEAMFPVLRAAGRSLYFNAQGSAWYNAAFFHAFGARSLWTTNDQGLFTSYDDNYNSDAGIKACMAIYNLVNTNKDVFVDNSEAGAAFKEDASGKIAGGALISGTWDYAAAKGVLGENLGAIELPYVTVGEERVHLGSFKGFKLMGVKQQKDPERAAYAQLLAQYLTSKECQLDRFNQFGWGPSNKEAQQDPAVQENIALTALRNQNAYALEQGQYPQDWWTGASNISKSLAAETCKGTRAEIVAILRTYEATVDTYVNG